jgi:hypothetical protein
VGIRELHVRAEGAAHSPFDATEIGIRASVSPDPVHPRDLRFAVHIDAADLLPRPAPDQDAGKVRVALTPDQFASATNGEIGFSEALPVAPAICKVRVIAFYAALDAVGSVTIPMRR